VSKALEAVKRVQGNATDPNIWTITRNDRVYDRVDHTTHTVVQIARSLADDMPNDLWQVWDSNCELVYAVGPVGSVKP
jgi:hypothetical protein